MMFMAMRPGDLVLQEFSERLRTNIRPKGHCLPSWAVRNSLVIMPETPGDLAYIGAERIRHAIANDPFLVERKNEEIRVTVSAGVATHYGEDALLADLLHRADQALYKAKENGRNRIEKLAA